MPIKKHRAVNLHRPTFLLPRLKSYELPGLELHRDRIEVAHRERGRVIVRHTLAESCDECENLNGKKFSESLGRSMECEEVKRR
jgi:hypothetical protein